ncbi:MAG TPA: cytochrome P450 [Kofleriaceae bacterium]|nr:cytochrome P450 [Kofleriaceae bacterium]
MQHESTAQSSAADAHPRAVPRVAGHLLLGSLLEFRRDRIGFLLRVAREYGDIARVRFGFLMSGVIISAPDLAREALVERDDAFVKGVGLSVFARPLLGEGLLTSERDLHRRQRRMMAPAFMPRRIAEYADTIAACADRSVERLAAAGSADLSREMMQLTLEVAGRTLFHSDLSGDAGDVYGALTAAMEHVSAQISRVVPLPPSVPSPANLRVRRDIERLDEVIYRLIRQRRAAGGDAGDLLSMLLLARDQDDGGVMTDKQVRDEAMTIMLAAHETTANALVWSLYLLAHNPDVRARLEDEVDRVLGGRSPDLAALAELPCTLQVFKEAMRLYPPAYMVVRRATRDVALGGHQVRKGEAVIVNIVGMHRRAEHFPDPLRFRPERFTAAAEKALDRHVYLPFGGGPRVCIGNHFALMEGHIALARLVQELRFDLVPGRERAELEPLITLRPKGGMPMRISRRERASAAPSASRAPGV